jgi:hypothetical protein
MSIELARLRHGGVALLTDEALPGKIGSVEYFRAQHYLQISYENTYLDPLLIAQELPDEAITAIECAADEILIVTIAGDAAAHYHVPLTAL